VSNNRVHIVHVCGARPNFMKVAPVIAAVEVWNARSHAPTAAGVLLD
jgi:UDP-N-acetylglucosamine 2-epimerase